MNRSRSPSHTHGDHAGRQAGDADHDRRAPPRRPNPIRAIAGHDYLPAHGAPPTVTMPLTYPGRVRLRTPAEVDAEFAGWLAEAYRVGEQRHLRP